MPAAEPHPELPLFDEPRPPDQGSEAKRIFLGWDRPLLAATVEHLTLPWKGDRPLDLSDRLVVVPTRHAGRRLREALAIRAGEQNSAVFPPLVVTPDFLISAGRLPAASLPAPPASPSLTLLVWTGVLRHLALEEFRQIFPIDPVERSLSWAAETAVSFLEVRRLLAESGHLFASTAVTLADHGIEPGRWEQLARLERLAVSELKRCGFADESELQLRTPGEGTLPPGIRAVVVCGVPDLRPLAAAALARYAAERPVEVLVHAPESEATAFDPWGRPLAEAWENREIPIESPETRIHPSVAPADQASLVARLLSDLPDPASVAAVGLPDPSLAPAIGERLAEEGVGTYDPSGSSLRQEGVYHLLKTTAELISTESFAALRRLLACPGVPEMLLGPGSKSRGTAAQEENDALFPTQLIILADEMVVEGFPDQVEDALFIAKSRSDRHPQLLAALERARKLARELDRPDFEETLYAYLAEVHAQQRFSHQDPMRGVLGEVADAIHELASDLASAKPAFRGKSPSGGEAIELLLKSLGSRRRYPERDPRDLDLNGWLELPWEDAPRLVLAGMNDHCVPETVLAHAFLPDTARRLLAAPHNASRFARDAFLLTSMLECRRTPGARVDLVFGKENADGDPLRPSRLLFQCGIDELPERTLRLFREVGQERRLAARSVAFPLRPEPLSPENRVFSRLSATSIRQYLACPFRFYLKHGLGMQVLETNKRELSAADFGNLVHDALEAFAKDGEARRLGDPGEILALFEAEIERLLKHRFGRHLPIPVLIQRDAARRRLAWWAEEEAAQRAEGWRIVEPECRFGEESWPFAIAGMTIRGRIDRIEEHDQHGLRVVDFKTGSMGSQSTRQRSAVEQYHLATLKRTQTPGDFPEWSLFEAPDGKPSKPLRWCDLQLPLYLLAMRARGESRPIRAAHATLGPSREEVRLEEWSELDAPVLASAERCAAGVVESVRAQRFWPPSAESSPWDDFRDLLSPSPGETVLPFPEAER